MLRDLSIKNYRCFENFSIDGLARVNLLVGSNNSGKTSFLEAVYLLANQVEYKATLELLQHRGEISQNTPFIPSRDSNLPSEQYQIKHLFYERKIERDRVIKFHSKDDTDLSLEIEVQSIEEVKDQAPGGAFLFSTAEGISSIASGFLLLFSYSNDIKIPVPIREDGSITAKSLEIWKRHKPGLFSTSTNPRTLSSLLIPSILITTETLNLEKLAIWWNDIALTPKEDRVIEALQILDPNIIRIAFISRPVFDIGILVKINGESEPIPLGSMGGGMRRILTLIMAAVTVENGILLVDEIDTGLHHTVQLEMWKLIFEIAIRLNVQVFSTTHSWDCISAFQEAMEEMQNHSIGKLIRLDSKSDTIRTVEYLPEELDAAVRQGIEVR